MLKTIISAIAFISVFASPGVAAAQLSDKIPDTLLAKYVVEQLDLSSINSSIKYRWQQGKNSFADYGFTPISLSNNKAILESKNKDWIFEVVVVNHDKDTITICLHDLDKDGISFDTESILQLHRSGDKLEASRSSWITGKASSLPNSPLASQY